MKGAYRSEESFEIVGKFSSARVTGIHRDKNSIGSVVRKFDAFKHKFSDPSCGSLLDDSNLLGDDGQHFNVNTIEFVKARPCAGSGQSLEKLGHGQIVELIGTIEDNTLLCQRFGQILCCLCFTRTSGPSRGLKS
jgi:hypothetical protein